MLYHVTLVDTINSARKQHRTDAVKVFHGVILVKVIDNVRESLVVQPPFPTLRLRTLTRPHLNFLRDSQVLLFLDSSRESLLIFDSADM